MAIERLPRGRHGLTREQVRRAQRDRMLVAVAEAVADQGYVDTSVADVIKRAGVSRETFYQQFSSKLDCFTSAFDAAAELLFASLEDLPTTSGTPMERFEAAFTGYLDSLAEHPVYARMFLVEVYAAGPEAIARRAALQRRIVDQLAAILEVHGERGRFACELLVAGTGSMVTGPLVAGDLDALRALRAPIIDLVQRALATDPAR